MLITNLILQFRAALILSQRSRSIPRPKNKPAHLVIVLGSGGHTAEMMSLLRDIDPRRYTHRTYIISSGDNFSSSKAEEIERIMASKWNPTSEEMTKSDTWTGNWDVKTVPRARKIHQSLHTTPFSALWCLLSCLHALISTSRSKTARCEYPDAIITNGPATAVMVIMAANILKMVGLAPASKLKTIYVESWARVKTLSLSGKILLHTGVCDRFLVQWEALANSINGNSAQKRVDWMGFLV